jgi:hypothetical protein
MVSAKHRYSIYDLAPIRNEGIVLTALSGRCWPFCFSMNAFISAGACRRIQVCSASLVVGIILIPRRIIMSGVVVVWTRALTNNYISGEL